MAETEAERDGARAKGGRIVPKKHRRARVHADGRHWGYFGERHYQTCLRSGLGGPPGTAPCTCAGVERDAWKALAVQQHEALEERPESEHDGGCSAGYSKLPCKCSQQSRTTALAAYNKLCKELGKGGGD